MDEDRIHLDKPARNKFLANLWTEVREKLYEKNIDYKERMQFYRENLVEEMVIVIECLEYKETDMHQMVHDIIKDIEEEASNAFLERKEK